MPTDDPTDKQKLLRKLNQYQRLPRQPHKRIYHANKRVLYGLRRYVLVGGHVGHFLEQLLSNNFVGTVGRADDSVVQVLDALSTYLNMYPPAPSWGSAEHVQEWRERDGYLGMYGPDEAWKKLQSDPL